MKKILASVLAFAMTLSLAVVPVSAAAAPITFSPSAEPGTTTGETTVETGIPALTLTIGADAWTYKADSKTSASDVTYTGYIVGKANPNVANKVGTYYTFTFDNSFEAGTLEIMVKIGDGKAFYILDNGTAMTGYDGNTALAGTHGITFMVEGGHSYTTYCSGSKMSLYGCTFNSANPAEIFAEEIDGLTFDLIKGANTAADQVEENLTLVQSYESQFGSCDVSWTSSAPAVITTSGVVSMQAADTQVTLTGHFSVQENNALSHDKTFTVTVLGDPDDQSAVEVAKAALTLGDTSGVKKNMTLPDTGKRGTAVTWASSDPTVVGVDGKVYPSDQEAKTVTLTATITRGTASVTKEFAVTVAQMVPVTLDAWTYATSAGAVCFTPANGGKLHTVNITSNDPNPADGAKVTVTVKAADGSVKATKDIAIKTTFADIPVGKSVAVTVDLAMDSTDTFELTLDNGDAVPANDVFAENATIYVVGDSTAAVYGDKDYPRKGWAQMLGGFFTGAAVNDLALSGRSSLSFKSDEEYNRLKNSIKKGDYLIIQFGHNDSKVGETDRYTDPAKDRFTDGAYKASLLEYVELAWDKGAHPILATSISRRKTSDASLETYVAATRALAGELSLPCIDLYAKTNGWINEVGLETAKDMFNYVKKHDSRFLDYANFAGSDFYAAGTTDDTHININGAELIAQWAAEALKEQGVPVAAKVNSHQATYPLPSYADATEGAAAQPTATSTPTPTATATPTATPTANPSTQPSAEPSVQPSAEPSVQPSAEPAAAPTNAPASSGGSSSGSSGGGGSSSTAGTTVKNPDGSSTKTQTDNRTGTVTETTTKADGTKEVVETKKDGTVTETVTAKDGSKSVIVTKPDGSSSATVVDAQGVRTVAETTAQGETTATVTVPGKVEQAVVTVPKKNATPGTVAVVVKADGTEEVVKVSAADEDGLKLLVSENVTVKLVDNAKSFDDVAEGYWAKDAVDFASAREIFKGTTDTTFAPAEKEDRATMATVLYRLEGAAAAGESAFDDVASDAWYADAIAWANDAGVVTGYADGSFGPADQVTREQLATMLYRYAGTLGMDVKVKGDLAEYGDADKVAAWASNAMAWAVGVGLINGTSDGVNGVRLSPNATASRAEVATILERMVKLMVG